VFFAETQARVSARSPHDLVGGRVVTLLCGCFADLCEQSPRLPVGVGCLLLERLRVVAVSTAGADLCGECAELFRARAAAACVPSFPRCNVAAVARAESWRPAGRERFDVAAADRAETRLGAQKLFTETLGGESRRGFVHGSLTARTGIGVALHHGAGPRW
jgi:hypothetical protein